MTGTNISGLFIGTRQSSVPAVFTWVVSGNTSTTATRIGTISASAEQPAIIEAQVCVSTVDGGSSPTLSVGYTASGYTDLINVASTATAATGGTFLPASNAVGKKRIVANTDIYFKQGGTPDGAGVTTIILTVSGVNTGQITS